MCKVYAFYNPLAGKGACKEDVRFLELLYDEPIVYCDLTKAETYEQHLFSLQKEDLLILCGGDGTLQRFFNLVCSTACPCDILYFPLGQENRFTRSLGYGFGCMPFSLRPFLTRLPSLSIQDHSICFFSHIFYEGSRKNRCSITLCVDGKTQHFSKPKRVCVTWNCKHSRLEVSVWVRRWGLFSKTLPPLWGKQITLTFSQPSTVCADGEYFPHISAYTAIL